MLLDHITIRTHDLVTTRAFFLRVFDDLEERPRPRPIRQIPGHWLYFGNEPLIHLIGIPPHAEEDRQADGWDHICFRLEGYEAFRAKLERLGIAYSPMELPELGERRLFFRTPTGQLIETVFRETDQRSA